MIVILTDGSYSDYGIVCLLDVPDGVDLEAVAAKASEKAKAYSARYREVCGTAEWVENWREANARLTAEFGGDGESAFVKADLLAQGAKVIEYKELNT